MYFDLYLRKDCTLFGEEFSNLFNNMKDDRNLENKHKECLEYYKDEDLISYKSKIEPLILHILNSNKLNEYEEEIKKLKSENQSLKNQLNNAKNQSFNSFMKDNRFR